MPTPKPTDGVYERMLKVWKVKDYNALGSKLEVQGGSIRQNKSEGKVPQIYIIQTMLGTGCRKEWLFTGEGDIYRGDLLVADLSAPLQAAVKAMRGASDEAQAIFETVANFLATNQAPVIQAIEDGAIIAERRIRIAGNLRNRVPEDTSEEPAD